MGLNYVLSKAHEYFTTNGRIQDYFNWFGKLFELGKQNNTQRYVNWRVWLTSEMLNQFQSTVLKFLSILQPIKSTVCWLFAQILGKMSTMSFEIFEPQRESITAHPVYTMKIPIIYFRQSFPQKKNTHTHIFILALSYTSIRFVCSCSCCVFSIHYFSPPHNVLYILFHLLQIHCSILFNIIPYRQFYI